MKKNLLPVLFILLVGQISFAQISPPVYDNCAAAMPVPVTTSLTCTGAVIFNNIDATPTAAGVVPLPGCGSFTDGVTPDVWFQFTTGILPYHHVEVDPDANGGAVDLAMALYTGACNGPWNLLACDDNSNGANMPMATLTSLASGTEVYIRVWSNNGTNPGNFRICVAMNNVTDVQQNEPESFYLFPNPFENAITFSTPLKNCTVRVFDSMSAIVITAREDELFEVNTSHLKAGLYVVEITSGEFSTRKKIIRL